MAFNETPYEPADPQNPDGTDGGGFNDPLAGDPGGHTVGPPGGSGDGLDGVDPGSTTRRPSYDPYPTAPTPRRRIGPPSPSPTPQLPETPSPPPDTPPSDATPILPAPVQLGPSRTDTFVPPRDWVLPVVYGPYHTGGARFYDYLTPGSVTVVAYAICWGPINAISNITIDGQDPYATWGAQINVHLGTASQTTDTIGSSYDPTRWTSGLPYVAYVVVAFPAGTQIPDVSRFNCDVQGKLVYDQRTDPTLTNTYYRDNPALCAADFLISTQYGESQPISEVYSSSLSTAANDCDVNIGGGTKRYVIGCRLDKQSSQQTREFLRSHGQLNITKPGKEFVWWVDAAQSAQSVLLTDGIGDGNASTANVISAGPLIVAPLAQAFTRCRVNFQNAAADFKDDFVVYPTGALPAGVDEVVRTYDLGQIPADQASRLAKQLYKRAQMDKSFPIQVLPDVGEQIVPGVVVPVTSQQLNLAAFNCIVTDWAPSSDPMQSSWVGRCEYYSADVYDDTKVTVTSSAPPANPSPYDAPPESIGFITNSSGNAYWSAPPVRGFPVITSGNWSAVGATTFDATKINNGNLTDVALVWPASLAGFDPISTPSGARVTFNTGGQIIRELHVTFVDDLSTNHEVSMIPYYFDGTTWASPTAWYTNRVSNFKVIYYFTALPGTPTAIALAPNTFTPAAPVARIAEIQPITYVGVYPYAAKYRLTGLDLLGNLWQKDIDFTPSATTPIKLEEWTQLSYTYFTQYVASILTAKHTLLQVQPLSPGNVTSVATAWYESTASFAPTGTDTPSHLGTGSILTASPTAGDNSTKISTTEFVATSFATITTVAGKLDTTTAAATYVPLASLLAARSASDTSWTATTTPSDVSGLSLSLAASTTYEIKADLYVANVNITSGIRVQLAGTAGVSALIADVLILDDTGTTQNSSPTRITAFSSVVDSTSGVKFTFHISIRGTITTTTAGTLKIQGAQAVSDSQAAKIKTGSVLTARAIA